jgi:hypothetical protein
MTGLPIFTTQQPISSITTPAKWINQEHRIGTLMCKELYSKHSKNELSDIQDWKFVEKSERLARYVKNDQNIVVFRGTLPNSGFPSASKDLMDDIRIAMGKDDSVELVKEGRKYMQILLDSGIPSSQISLTGHSLGGYAALKLSQEFGLRSFVFNPAAPASSPITTGPGPLTSSTYHIVGDGISSHMADNTSRIIRAYKNTNFFQTGFNHALARFDENDPIYGFWELSSEIELFLNDVKIAEDSKRAIFSAVKRAIHVGNPYLVW